MAENKKQIPVKEFINKDGTFIKGDRRNTNSEITSSSTTDQVVAATRQGSSAINQRRYFGEENNDNHPMNDIYKKSKSRAEFVEKAKSKKHSKEDIDDAVNKFYPVASKIQKKEIDEAANEKMKNLLEVILNDPNDNDYNDDVLRRDDIILPTIDEVYEANAILGKRLNDLVKMTKQIGTISDEAKVAIIHELVIAMNMKTTDRRLISKLKKTF